MCLFLCFRISSSNVHTKGRDAPKNGFYHDESIIVLVGQKSFVFCCVRRTYPILIMYNNCSCYCVLSQKTVSIQKKSSFWILYLSFSLPNSLSRSLRTYLSVEILFLLFVFLEIKKRNLSLTTAKTQRSYYSSSHRVPACPNSQTTGCCCCCCCDCDCGDDDGGGGAAPIGGTPRGGP